MFRRSARAFAILLVLLALVPPFAGCASRIAPRTAPTGAVRGPGELPLRGYQFDVVMVDSSGTVTNRRKGRVVSRLPKVNTDVVSDPSSRNFQGHKLPASFKGDSLPVQQVSWEDAIEFCERLSHATRRIYRLPTEAEWEYAARGGTTTAFYFGETLTPELVNYDGNKPYGSAPKGISRQTTTPVGSLGYPNAFGLFDMHGNVWEWCMDSWHDSYVGAPTDGSSWETTGDARRRVIRGSSYNHDANHNRAAMRVGPPATPSLGFRVVARPANVGGETP